MKNFMQRNDLLVVSLYSEWRLWHTVDYLINLIPFYSWLFLINESMYNSIFYNPEEAITPLDIHHREWVKVYNDLNHVEGEA